MHRVTNIVAPRRAFTLTELLVAVVVLLGVLIACSRIFNTTSQVTRIGQANADVLQEAAAIEQLLREDFRRLSTDGIFAIRNVAIRNDIHGAVLLNPALAPDAMIRADQLLYFVHGSSEVTTPTRFDSGDNLSGLGTAARVYFGHAYQLGEFGLPAVGPPNAPSWRGHDVTVALKPWEHRVAPPAPAIPARFTQYSVAPFYSEAAAADEIRMPRVDARRWILAREQIVLADDDTTTALTETSRLRYLREIQTLYTIFLNDPVLGQTLGENPVVHAGRVDAAASDLRQVRQRLSYRWGGTPARPINLRPWSGPADDQWTVIGTSLLNYPRAERRAPSMIRIDQSLTSSVLGAACSSIRIDWTYAEGTGAFPEANLAGVRTRPQNASQLRLPPWFGMREPQRRVYPYGDNNLPPEDQFRWERAPAIYPNNVERWDASQPLGADLRVYEAFFGFNRDRGVVRNASGDLVPDFDLGYTPWPTAIRVTLTLHDAALALDAGREVQFVIELPRRGQSQ